MKNSIRSISKELFRPFDSLATSSEDFRVHKDLIQVSFKSLIRLSGYEGSKNVEIHIPKKSRLLLLKLGR